MAYTPAFAAGDILTAANMNSIGDGFATYGSGSSWTATTSNPAVGTGGSVSLRYQQLNKLVHVRGKFTMGTSPTVGSGSYELALPVTAQSTGWTLGDPIGVFNFYDASVNRSYSGQVLWWSTTKVRFFWVYSRVPVIDINTTYTNETILTEWSSGVPVNIATSDEFKFTFWYEAA